MVEDARLESETGDAHRVIRNHTELQLGYGGRCSAGVEPIRCAGLDGPLATCQGLFNESDDVALRRPN